MTNSYKPAGYNAVSPYFVCDYPHDFADFLEVVFDGTRLRAFSDDNNRLVHAEMKLYDSVIMYSSSNENHAANKLLVHIYLTEVEEVFNKAIAYGCKSINAPVQQSGDPDKRGNFEDPWGNFWSIASQIENGS